MKKTTFSMAMLSATAAFALLTGAGVQAQSMSNQNAASGTPATTTAQAASNPNAATQTAQGQSGQSGAQGATASGTGAATLNKADQKLVRTMAMMNMAEIETARMALSKSQSAEVKAFAQRMIDDHTRGLTEVQQLAQAKGMTLPTELDKTHKAMGARLAKMSGEQFDKAYMAQAGVADHKKAHAQLNTAAKSARDADVKALAGRLHPTVQEHLKMAQEKHGGHAGTAATGSSGAAGTTASGSGAAGTSSTSTGTTGTTGTGAAGSSDKAPDKR